MIYFFNAFYAYFLLVYCINLNKIFFFSKYLNFYNGFLFVTTTFLSKKCKKMNKGNHLKLEMKIYLVDAAIHFFRMHFYFDKPFGVFVTDYWKKDSTFIFSCKSILRRYVHFMRHNQFRYFTLLQFRFWYGKIILTLLLVISLTNSKYIYKQQRKKSIKKNYINKWNHMNVSIIHRTQTKRWMPDLQSRHINLKFNNKKKLWYLTN